MQPALWVSKTGLSAQDTQLTTVSNNLANAATIGFKRDRAVFSDLLYQIQRQPGAKSSASTRLPSGLQLGTGVRVVGTTKQFTQGSLQTTEQPLDMAINGRGFFKVTLADGSTSGYTRNGQFHIDDTGNVVTAEGFILDPGVSIGSNATNITVSEGGMLSYTDAVSGTLTEIQLNISDFPNPAGLQSIGGNVYIESSASGTATDATPGTSGLGKTLQFTLENSNVDIVEEMVNMITTQRAYEMNSKVISTADQMLQFISQNL